MSNIGKDADLYGRRVRLRADKLIKMLRGKYPDFFRSCDSWLDVGAGDSYLRKELRYYAPYNAITTSRCNLDERRYRRSGYKLITSFDVLEHLYNPLFHLKELRRVIADDGDLLLTTPNDQSLIYKFEHLISLKYGPHVHQYSERDLRRILELAGFKIVELRKLYRSPCGTLARISRNGLFVHCKPQPTKSAIGK